MSFSPVFWTSHVGSLPHRSSKGIAEKLIALLDIPAWPQFPKRSFRESMYVQYGAGLPNAIVDEEKGKIIIDTAADLSGALESFYARYLADDVDSFALRHEDAEGFYALLDALRRTQSPWLKGQVTGPVSFGLTVTDQDLRSVLYHDMLADVIVKQMAMNARWQAQQLLAIRPHALIFVDEPYLASYGSAFVSLEREQAIAMLDEVFDAIHTEGAVAGVHCCGNTDWSLLMATQVDVLNLDAYDFLDTLALYPVELRAFLDRGGVVAWGIVPNTEVIQNDTPESLARKLQSGIELICQKAAARGIEIDPAEFFARSLIVPACGLGPTTVEVAERALRMLKPVAEILRGE
jgi:methionine synthase II (cobalamin-independent)